MLGPGELDRVGLFRAHQHDRQVHVAHDPICHIAKPRPRHRPPAVRGHQDKLGVCTLRVVHYAVHDTALKDRARDRDLGLGCDPVHQTVQVVL